MSVAKGRAVNLSSLTGRQHWLAERPTGGKHRSSERPPLSATDWIVGHFHEKAGLVNLFFLAVPAKYPTTDQREAHYLASFPLVHNRRIAPLPSALFMEQSAPVPVGVLNLNGCCHLGTELNRLCFQKLPFLADAAVTRTRRSATDCNSSDYAATFFRSCWSLKFRSGSYTSPVTHNR
jgi:hypothetical protein